MSNKVLVAGASGLVGNAAVAAFEKLDGWEVVGVSRRVPKPIGQATLLSLDIEDPVACERLVADVGADVTHLVFAAQYDAPGLAPGWFDESVIDRNFQMLRNLFDPLVKSANGLEHITLLQGAKGYGLNHPEFKKTMRLPMVERFPRAPFRNWYFLQEDYLREHPLADRWRLTVLRPTSVYGGAPGANMNALLPLGVYAVLERAQGRPLDFPGATFDRQYQEAIDTELIAEAMVWAATEDDVKYALYNLTNGDVFTWPAVWPAIARSFGMEPGVHRPMSFQEDLPKRDDEWADLVERCELEAPKSIAEFVGPNSLVTADWMIGGLGDPSSPVQPFLHSTVAVRKAGFHACIDSEDMFVKWFERLQANGALPPQPAVEQPAAV